MNFEFSRNKKPFIIAEMSGNHNQSLERALEIVDSAASSGVAAIKIQTYTADTLTIDKSDGEFFISDPKSLWKGTSLYELYKKAYTPWEWHKAIFEHANKKGVLCFSSPFDFTAVDFLESLNAPAYKIASFENNDLPLIRKVASTKKPIIISTGMATIAEIAEAVDAVRSVGNEKLTLLKCTSTYPASPENTNILSIPAMRDMFRCEVGLSDHTMGIGVAVASVALGATVIEKHFTLRRADGGVDSTFSLEPEEMKALVVESERAWLSLGSVKLERSKAEEKSIIFKRSLYVVKDVKKGETFTSESVRSIRPGYGIPPKYIDIIIGSKAMYDIPRGTAVSWDMINGKK
ncbi:pseudaminic acid synthase [Leptospira levettii]|uniref:Pseudaminic acid synthase n=2 Tax=Leptospira levettii TaxID=2023178 RepID=A0ABY2MR31_9LEPT|nr:pseudaminic acid synthase [Leptospira levettii]TGL73250.1 pseudaminic acid synthase [Leptospira levettii]TGM25937.1 pseudaminic acid synthase [Leptospira levettii]TGM33449.1 pseudaminic acid synthase [Leptospira levettii]TGM35502.1 pseudaminic acid synthase [Leptospira levettii]